MARIEIAENLNNFFTSIGTNFQKKIPPAKKTFTDYLKKILQLLKKLVIKYIILNPAKVLALIVFPLKS